MKEQFVKLSDVKNILERACPVSEDTYDGEGWIVGYDRDDVDSGLAEISVYEFETPDTQDQKIEEPVQHVSNEKQGKSY